MARPRPRKGPGRPAVQVGNPGDSGLLVSGARELGIALAAPGVDQLMGFVELLRQWNRPFNLISRGDLQRVVTRHLLDSLSVNRFLRGPRVLDIGSGAGFPGIPLAVANPQRRFLLVDRNARKTRFLRHVTRRLGLTHVEVGCADARALEGTFCTVVGRAVAPVGTLWSMAEPLLTEGGRVVVMHRTRVGQGERPADSSAALTHLPGARMSTERVLVPGMPEPHEVLLLEAAR